MNTLMFLYPPLLRFFNISTTDKDVSNFFINAFKDMVEYRLANKVERKDFLDSLMQLITKGYLDGDEGAKNVKNVDISGNPTTPSHIQVRKRQKFTSAVMYVELQRIPMAESRCMMGPRRLSSSG